jgi:hypothetical protein
LKCPRCLAENRDDSKFCRNCAVPLHGGDPGEVSVTKTLETPIYVPKPGSLIAGKYKIPTA